jgi:glycosyltransferase involved in cell wall biosynthesis
MSLVGLRKELTKRGWDCQVMNLNENRRVRSPEYVDVQSGWDYFRKVLARVGRGYAVHVRVNGATKKGYALALCALGLARLFRRPALLTYAGGHQQSYFPAPRLSIRHMAFSLLFRVPHRIYCNSGQVKRVLLTTGIAAERVAPIPHFSTYYVQFEPTPLSDEVESFVERHEGVFFSYVCFRKEFQLDLFAEAVRQFRKLYPKIGFLWAGAPARELQPLRKFVCEEQIEDAVLLQGSLPHEMFLNLLSRSLAYIRTPLSDGVCASVLESLKLKVPVLATDNGTRPPGTELWDAADVSSLLRLMEQVLRQRSQMVARIPEITVEDNAKQLADDIEEMCRHFPAFMASAAAAQVGASSERTGTEPVHPD